MKSSHLNLPWLNGFLLHVPWFYFRFSISITSGHWKASLCEERTMKRAKKIASSNLSRIYFSDCQTYINLLLFHCQGLCSANRGRKGQSWIVSLLSWGKGKRTWFIKVSVQTEDSYLGRNKKRGKEMSNKKDDGLKKGGNSTFPTVGFTSKATIKWEVLDLLKAVVWFACMSIQPSPLPVSPIKPSGF